MVVILWIILSFVVAKIANDRRLGFNSGLMLSLIFSPLIGILITLASPRIEDVLYRQESLKTQLYQQKAAMKSLTESNENETGNLSVADEISKLNELLEKEVITKEEYLKIKKKVIGDI